MIIRNTSHSLKFSEEEEEEGKYSDDEDTTEENEGKELNILHSLLIIILPSSTS